ncbi:ORF6N domain-containing protein [Candidatus Parcubacteria bacterium]|nr:ORF6N domain-containing protein [Candidatus Parcubacteria bacterium]
MNKNNKKALGLVAVGDEVKNKIYVLREEKVMFDFDLAELYQVTTGALNQAVKRNRERFPADFVFTLNKAEEANLKSQFVISNYGRRRPIAAFTEQGIAMLSGVLFI